MQIDLTYKAETKNLPFVPKAVEEFQSMYECCIGRNWESERILWYLLHVNLSLFFVEGQFGTIAKQVDFAINLV